jgi:predicted ferric reductase
MSSEVPDNAPPVQETTVIYGQSKAAGPLLVALYLAIIISPLLLALAFSEKGDDPFSWQLGMSLPLIGFPILAMQFVLSARLRWVERPFGMDRLYQFHKAMGMFAGILLLSHPVVVAASKGTWSLLYGLAVPWFIWVGRAALLLLVIHVALAISKRLMKMDYQKWKALHTSFAGLILTGAFVHSWFAGDDLKLTAVRIVWSALFVGAGAAYAWHRILRPLLQHRQAYDVADVQKELSDVWTVTLAPKPGTRHHPHLPGQYHYLTLHREGDVSAEEHPFTISSSPTQVGVVSSTIKASGDLTRTIGRTKPGDTANIHGPFGRFSYVLHPDEHDLVFIAGGVGITPLMSMLRHMRDTGALKRVLLLYANKTPGDILFGEELRAMQGGDRPHLEVVDILSQPGEGWTGETGRIDREKIAQLCGVLEGRTFYVCGPPGLMDTAISGLKSLGVLDSRIRFESFQQ